MKKIYAYDLNIPSGLTPLYQEARWDGIKDYINKNKNVKILFFAPDLNEKEIEKMIGKNSNLEYLCTAEDGVSNRREIDSLLEEFKK